MWSISVVLLLAFLRPGAAQEQERPVLSLPEVIRSALERNERFLGALERMREADEEVVKARSFLAPRLTAEGRYTRRPDSLTSPGGFVVRPEERSEFSLSLNQTLYTGGRATAALKRARTGALVGREETGLAREDLIFNVSLLYLDLLKAKRDVEIAEAEVRRLTEHRRGAEKRLTVGEVTRTVLLRAEAELSGAKADLVRTRNAVSRTRDQIRLLAGIEEEFEPVDPPRQTVPVESMEEEVRRARERRPDLSRRRLLVDISREDVRSARGGFLPTLGLEAEYFRLLDENPQSSFAVTTDKSMTLKLTFPFFEGGLRLAELREAKFRSREAELDWEFLSRQIAVEVKGVRLDLEAIESEIENLKTREVFAEENFSLVSRQFAAGLATNIDILDANSTLLTAQRQLAHAVYDREAVLIRLKRAMGILRDEAQ